MKKVTLSVLAIIAISLQLFACHPEPTGFCTGNAYFKLVDFHYNYQIEYQYIDSVGNLKDSIITTVDDSEPLIWIPQPSSNVAVTLKWRYRSAPRNTWDPWNTTKSLCGVNEDLCYAVMPVTINNLIMKKKGDNLIVSFNAGDEDIDHYNIQVTTDEIVTDDTHWTTIGTLSATGKNSYTTSIDLLSIVGSSGAMLMLIGFMSNRKKNRILSVLAILCCVLYFSCSKEKLSNSANPTYKYGRVQPVDKDGILTQTNIVKI